jgi:hypothetical protein
MHQRLRLIRACEDHRAESAQRPNNVGVLIHDMIDPADQASVGGVSCDRDLLLERDGEAMEWAHGLARLG